MSVTAELLLSESILLANGDVIGEFGTVAGFTRVSGSRVVDIAGCSRVLHIPWLFLEGLPDPIIMFMSVTSLLISLHDAISFMEVCCEMQTLYYEGQSKIGQYQEFKWFLKHALTYHSHCYLN